MYINIFSQINITNHHLLRIYKIILVIVISLNDFNGKFYYFSNFFYILTIFIK